MGCSRTFACRTCKKAYSCGYGSYGSWLMADSPEEYDALPDKEGFKARTKNQNFRQCLGEHQGHDITYFSEDYTSLNRETGHLEMDGGWGPPSVYIEDFASYEKIRMDDGWDPVKKVQH